MNKNKKSFDFGADPDRDTDPGIMTEFYHCRTGTIARMFDSLLREMRCLAGVNSAL